MEVDHKMVHKIMVPMVNMVVITLQDLKEMCQFMEEAEDNLIKVQMLVDLES